MQQQDAAPPMQTLAMKLRIFILLTLLVLSFPALILITLGWLIFTQQDVPMRVLLALDQTWSAAFQGSEDETMSSRLGRAQRDGTYAGRIFAPLVDMLFGKDHCKKNIGE